MGNRFSCMNHRGFTLVELIISTAVLGILAVSVNAFIQDIRMNTIHLDMKVRALSEITIANDALSNIVNNSYGIVYEEVNSSDDLGKIVLYTDKLEKNKVSIYIEQDLSKDLSRIMVQRNSETPIPLHSDALFIEKFRISTSPNPKGNQSLTEVQPWISFSILWRNRSMLEQPTDDAYYQWYEKSKVPLYGRFVLRNYVPSSLKN